MAIFSIYDECTDIALLVHFHSTADDEEVYMDAFLIVIIIVVCFYLPFLAWVSIKFVKYDGANGYDQKRTRVMTMFSLFFLSLSFINLFVTKFFENIIFLLMCGSVLLFSLSMFSVVLKDKKEVEK